MSIMKLVTAIIKPQQVDNVKEDLNKLGIHGLTSTDVKGFGRQKGHTEFYRGSEFEVAFLPKTKLEVAITELDQVVRIRTGEKGPEAI
jgi:nitrogen regulatory protein P-II 2